MPIVNVMVRVNAREVMTPDVAPANPDDPDREGQVEVGGFIIRGPAPALRILAETLVDAADRADREN
jgi:hypothetical protein